MPVTPVNRDFLRGDLVELIGCVGSYRVAAVDHGRGVVTLEHTVTGKAAGNWSFAQVRRPTRDPGALPAEQHHAEQPVGWGDLP